MLKKVMIGEICDVSSAGDKPLIFNTEISSNYCKWCR